MISLLLHFVVAVEAVRNPGEVQRKEREENSDLLGKGRVLEVHCCDRFGKYSLSYCLKIQLAARGQASLDFSSVF